MSIHLSARSIERLKTCHLHIQRMVSHAAEISDLDFTVLEGVRTLERQRELCAKGASRTMKSRHLAGPDGLSHAIDLGVMEHGAVSWRWPLYDKLAVIVKRAALEVKVPIEWGGDWTKFKDGPHWQLPWAIYP